MPEIPFHVEVSTDAVKSVKEVLAPEPKPDFDDIVNKAIEKGKDEEAKARFV